MDYTTLTGTGLEVSRLCLGTMTYGDQVSESEGIRLTRAAVDAGVNFIDTANVYTGGMSERIVGKAIRGLRDKIVLATKVGGKVSDAPLDSGLSRRHILSEVEKSLKSLDTDYIDIYYMHCPDRGTPLYETLETLSDLVRAGKVRYVGISNYPAWQICDALNRCRSRSLAEPVVCQMVYNLITRGLEAEFFPFAKEFRRGTVVYNALAGGMLTGKHRRGAPTANTRFSLKKLYEDRYWSGRNFDAVDRLSKIAEQSGMTISEMAMRFCIRDGIDSILIGFSNERQLTENIRLIEGGPIPADAAAACDTVWNDLAGERFKYFR